MGADQPLDSIRLGKDEVQRLVASMDAGAGPAPAQSRRMHQRHAFVDHGVVLTVGDAAPGAPAGFLANPRSFLVASRNLSPGGIGLLHGGFLYVGTRCEVHLRDRVGGAATLLGSVAMCRHVSGRVHEIGVRFDEVVEVEQFSDERYIAGAPSKAELAAAERTTAEVPALSGACVVLVRDQVRRRRLLESIGATGADVMEASYLGAAIDAIRRGGVNLVVCGFDLTEASPAETLMTLRRIPFAGALLGLPGQRPLDPQFDRAIRPGVVLRGRPTNRDLMDALRNLAPAA